jgi:tRNA pseudouridine32 synthase / 23S rRNA pseudouridine746 synthase
MDFSAVDQWILWMDADLVVINKPAGLLSLPDGYKQLTPHLLTVLEPHLGKLWIVHRLDRDTSGVMLLARSAEAHHQLNDQFAGREIQKTYHALVWGVPAWDQILIDQALRKNGDRSHRTVIDPAHGKSASTSVRVLERFQNSAWVEVQPHTGYTHQIRAHLTWAGYPLIADPLYTPRLTASAIPFASPQKTASLDGEAVLAIQRVALHALEIRFHHPTSGEGMTFSAPYPADFAAQLQELRGG